MGRTRGRGARRLVWWSMAAACTLTSCVGGDEGDGPTDTVAVDAASTPPTGPLQELVAVVAATADDPLVGALVAAGVEVAAVVVDANPDGSCPAARPAASTARVGCAGTVVADVRAGTVVAVTVSEDRVREVLADLDPDHPVDVVLAAVPRADLGSTASITVIPPDLDPSAGYPELVASEVAGDDPVVYEVIDTAAGPARVATSVLVQLPQPGTAGTAGTDDTDVGVTAAPEAELVWAFDVGTPARDPGIHSRAAVDDRAVYLLGYDGVAYAVDLATGGELWRHQIAVIGDDRPPASASYVALVDDAVVMSYSPLATEAPNQRIVALNASDGKLLWERQMGVGDYGGHPVAVGRSVVLWLGDSDGANLVALEPRSGSELWRSSVYERPGWGPPRAADGQVFAGAIDGTLVGVDDSDGAERFKLDLPEAALVGVGGIASRPAWQDGTLFFGADDGVFRAVDTAAQTVRWDFETESADLPSSPLIYDDLIVFGAFDGVLYALDVNTGEARWTSRVGDALSSAARIGPDIVIGAGNNVIGVDPAAGTVRWRFATDGLIGDSPVAVDGDVVVQIRGRVVRLAPPN